MKNITLSLPDELLEQSRSYAQQHGTSLNELVRQLLRTQIHFRRQNPLEAFLRHTQHFSLKTKGSNWSRTDIYDRKIFS